MALGALFAERDVAVFLSSMLAGAPTSAAASAQWALARDGVVVLSGSFGPAPADSSFLLFSAGKPLVAAAVLELVGDGALSLDDAVATLIPGFGEHGKDRILLRYLLSHGAGIPSAWMRPDEFSEIGARRAAYRSWKVEWDPGTRFAYHHLSASLVLADIIEVITGADYRAAVRTVADDFSEGIHLGGADAADARVVEVMCIDETGAGTEQTVAGLPPLSVLNSSGFRMDGNPAGAGIASAAAVARFYQSVLARRASGDSPFLVATADIENANTDVRFDVPANWGLGFAIAGQAPSYLRAVFGSPASSETFGHNGTGGQVCWADPRSGVSFCYLTNELDFDVARARRRWMTASAAAASLAAATQQQQPSTPRHGR